MLLREVEVDGRIVDVRVEGATVTAVAPQVSPNDGEELIDGGGGALLPGLHDHHLHLLAMAAADSSVSFASIRQAPGDGWIRVTGYVESMGGDLDRDVLDRIETSRPVRVQHRSGALWMLNSAAIVALGLEDVHLDGLERDAAGRVTGRLWRLDGWLADWMAEVVGSVPPQLGAVGQRLASLGITGVTDATPSLDARIVDHLVAARRSGALPQRLQLLGASSIDPRDSDIVTLGPMKVVIGDHHLPTYDELLGAAAEARASGRAVAVHCVTREALALTIAVLTELGPPPRRDGQQDRIEHGAVIDLESASTLAALGVAVVTQPGFIADRGDDYLREVAACDHDDLYRFGSLASAGVSVVASSDAPFGPLDPWATIAAAADRRTAAGTVLGASERVGAMSALEGLLRPLDDLGGAPRRVRPGAPGDLVLLHLPLEPALKEPSAGNVRMTWCGGSPHAGQQS